MHVPSFRETVLSQLGQRELRTAIEVDLAGETVRARPLDADAKGALRDIHKRVGTAMLFESTGGQIDRVAHLPELRFALGEPDVETTTIDTRAFRSHPARTRPRRRRRSNPRCRCPRKQPSG